MLTLRFQYLLNFTTQTIKYAINTTQPGVSQCPERKAAAKSLAKAAGQSKLTSLFSRTSNLDDERLYLMKVTYDSILVILIT